MPSSDPRSTASVVRRSGNPFLLYRRDAVTSGAVSKTLVDSNGESKYKTQMEISREVGKMWNSAPEGVKILYRGLAAEMKREGSNETSTSTNSHVGVHPCNTQIGPNPNCHACSVDVNLALPQQAPTQLTAQSDRRSKRQASRCSMVPKTKIPRPENAFILYRREALASGAVETRTTSECGLERPRTQSELSKDIAFMWHNAPERVKSYYNALAEEKRREHKEKYPEYKFSPNSQRKAGRASSAPSLVSKKGMKGCSCRCSAARCGS
ncbi:hypothetical protein PM082_022275 [Marasmius tenuissimus]|nr:hypothetical protein PM082_022275 [Marasmius tenuissimus]